MFVFFAGGWGGSSVHCAGHVFAAAAACCKTDCNGLPARGAVRYHVDITAAHNPTRWVAAFTASTDSLTTGEVFENALANEAHYQGPNGVSPVTVPYVCNNRRAAGPSFGYHRALERERGHEIGPHEA